MVRDVVGETDDFGRDPTGGGDHDAIIFSIEQLANPADPDGYYATGSELFRPRRIVPLQASCDMAATTGIMPTRWQPLASRQTHKTSPCWTSMPSKRSRNRSFRNQARGSCCR